MFVRMPVTLKLQVFGKMNSLFFLTASILPLLCAGITRSIIHNISAINAAVVAWLAAEWKRKYRFVGVFEWFVGK